MNWKPTQPPKSDIAARFARTSAPERRMPSRTSGAGVRALARDERGEDRATARRASRACAPRPSPRVGRLDERVDEQQHRRGHAHRAGDVERAQRTRPGGCSRGTSRKPASSVTSATGAGRKKTQRQPISVSRPPKTRPSEKPVAPVAV